MPKVNSTKARRSEWCCQAQCDVLVTTLTGGFNCVSVSVSIRSVKKNVLFICVQNSARSQIAAALLNEMCGDYFEAHSAGLQPGVLNPLAVEALQERGIDISRNKTQSVFDVWKSAQHIFTYVVTVCSESEAEACPIFAGV